MSTKDIDIYGTDSYLRVGMNDIALVTPGGEDVIEDAYAYPEYELCETIMGGFSWSGEDEREEILAGVRDAVFAAFEWERESYFE